MANENLLVKLGLDNSGFLQGLEEANAKLVASSKDMESRFGKISEAARKTGVAMMAFGGAIVGGLVAAGKAAEDERINVARLESQLGNVGVAYADVKDELEAYITTMQRKTGIADDEQRDALGRLIMVTGDYKRSLELLPLALDLAAAKQIDVSTAADVVGRVAQGNTGILSRYGIVLGEGATAAEALATMQERVAGAAEATASPFEVLKASLSDMTESIGAAVLPALTNFIEKLTNAVDKIKIWADEHPTLIKWIGALGLALIGAGGLLFAIGSIIKIVKSLQAAFIAVRLAMITVLALSGPAGWVALAAVVGIAATAIWGLNELTKETTDSLEKLQNVAANTDLYGPWIPGQEPAAAIGETETGETTADKPFESTGSSALDWVKKRVEDELKKLPSYEFGGIIPGPIGQPVPIIAHGGEEFLGVGAEQRVGGSQSGPSITVNNPMLLDNATMRSFFRQLQQIAGEEGRRNFHGPVNRGYGFGTSGL